MTNTTLFSQYLATEDDTVFWGEALGRAISQGGVVYLEGTLGAGKTTFCRGVLSAFGYSGSVKSPTYTLVENYELAGIQIYHFDLYRLADPEELEFMGIRDYFSDQAICLIEWPSRGAGILPMADIVVKVTPKIPGRSLDICGQTKKGGSIIGQVLQAHPNFEIKK